MAYGGNVIVFFLLQCEEDFYFLFFWYGHVPLPKGLFFFSLLLLDLARCLYNGFREIRFGIRRESSPIRLSRHSFVSPLFQYNGRPLDLLMDPSSPLS